MERRAIEASSFKSPRLIELIAGSGHLDDSAGVGAVFIYKKAPDSGGAGLADLKKSPAVGRRIGASRAPIWLVPKTERAIGAIKIALAVGPDNIVNQLTVQDIGQGDRIA